MTLALLRRPTPAAFTLPALGLAALVTVAGCGASSAGADDGPLRFPDGYEAMLLPLDGGAFSVLEACAEGGPAKVERVAVEPVELTGADSVEFRVGWPTPARPSEWGAGPLPLPKMFGATDRGTARACADPPAGLEIAAVFPEAVGRAIVVDGVQVTYTIDGVEYREVADVRLGLCASEPTGGQQPAGCPE